MAESRAHVGRGHRIPMSVVQSIIGAVSGGRSVAAAAAEYGYSDRTVYRLAASNPLIRKALTTALTRRRVLSIEGGTERLAEVVHMADADRCPDGCCCDVCEAERLLAARRADRQARS